MTVPSPSNSSTPLSAMDDVDRLFRCFKCGISPPESAVRERKRCTRKWQEGSSMHEASASSTLSPGSSGQRRDEATGIQVFAEKLGSTTIRACKFSQGEGCISLQWCSPNGVPPKRPSSLLRLLNEIRVDLAAQNSSQLRNEMDHIPKARRSSEVCQGSSSGSCVQLPRPL